MKKLLFNIMMVTSVMGVFLMSLYFLGWDRSHHKISTYLLDYFSRSDSGYPYRKAHFLSNESDIFVNDEGVRFLNYKENQHHFIVAGGSNVAGWKIKAEDTLMNNFFRSREYQYHSFITFAYPGWGPNNLLSRFNSIERLKLTSDYSGFFIYFFLDIHFERVCGSDAFYTWSAGMSPQYKMKRGKLFNTDLYNRTMDYHKLIIKNGMKKVLHKVGLNSLNTQVDMSVIDNQDCRKLFLNILKEIISRYYTKFPKGKFIIPFYSFSRKEDLYIDEFKRELNAEFISIRELVDLEANREVYFQKDGHFSKEGIRVLAEKLLPLLR